MFSQRCHTWPNLFALTLAIVLPLMMVEAMNAAEIQKPYKGSTPGAKASSSDGERRRCSAAFSLPGRLGRSV